MNNIIYNGTSLRDLGFAVKKFPVHTVAERDLSFNSVIGRSGDIIVDNKRFNNVDMNYEINMIDFGRLQNTDVNERRLIDWLMTGDSDYKVLEDSTVPGYFCYALCTGIGDLQQNGLNGFIDTSISFNRMPFWYSKEGQNKLVFETLNTEHTIINPEKFTSEPYFKIISDGTSAAHFDLIVNGDSYPFTGCGRFIEIDCEQYNVYEGTVDKNALAKFNYMPAFKPGINTFSVVEYAVSALKHLISIEIIPRWRRL